MSRLDFGVDHGVLSVFAADSPHADNDRFRFAPNGVPWERYFPWWSAREEARALPKADRLQYLIDFLSEQPRCELDFLHRFYSGRGATFFSTAAWCCFLNAFRVDFDGWEPVVMLLDCPKPPHVCGTAGCAIGWTVMLFGDFSPMELYWRSNRLFEHPLDWPGEAADLLGVAREHVYRISQAQDEVFMLWSLKHLRDHGCAAF